MQILSEYLEFFVLLWLMVLRVIMLSWQHPLLGRTLYNSIQNFGSEYLNGVKIRNVFKYFEIVNF